MKVRDSLVERVDRTAYRAQQLGLLVQFASVRNALLVLSGGHRLSLPGNIVRMVRKRYFDLLQRDLANVHEGLYPRQLLFQFPFLDYARTLPLMLRDVPRILARRQAGDYRDLPADVDLDRYPPYYRRNFHWQTDGYFSRRSAELYDVGVELLFYGMADVMRRQVIPPVTRFLCGTDPGGARLLDVGCGTGRMLKQLAISHPRLPCTGLDLSPHYLDVARQNLADVAAVSLVADNAEHMPFASHEFDVVTSVYLFHELPRPARRRVFAEMDRVLRPGGLLVLEDAAQLSESADIAPVLHKFPEDFHEPYFDDYLGDDLAALAQGLGFQVESVESHFVAKVVVARKQAN